MFDPVSYLMGKKSGGGGGGPSIANALFVTMTPNQDSTEVTTDFTAGQIAEMISDGGNVFVADDGTVVCLIPPSFSHDDYIFYLCSLPTDNFRVGYGNIVASSADSTTFTLTYN